MRRELLDIPIDWLTLDEAMRKITQFVLSKKPHQITTVNPEFIVESRKNPEFKKVLQQADLSLADGTGITLAQRLKDLWPDHAPPILIRWLRFYNLALDHVTWREVGHYQRITGVDLAVATMEQAAQNGWKVFLLGSMPGVAKSAAKIWCQRYPGLTIVGTSHANPDDPTLISTLKRAKPDILLVAYGAPKQDLFIYRNKAELNIPVMIGVGGTFDYITGKLHRAPEEIRALGLEWFYRLAQQPKRFKRIWRALIVFPLIVIRDF